MPPSSPSPLVGEAAPSLARPTVQGAQLPPGWFAGKVVAVDFFAAYCAPCMRRLPRTARLGRLSPELVVVGVSLDETADAAATLVARYRLDFPVVHDSGHLLAGRFRVRDLPAAFVIDRAGRVVWAGGPEQPEAVWEQAVRAALAGPVLEARQAAGAVPSATTGRGP